MTSTTPTGQLSGRTARNRLQRRSRASNEPQPYDFRRPTKLSREHVRTLQIAYETFARQYTTLMTTSLRTVAQITLISIEQLTYDEYISSLANPTIMIMISADPLPGVIIHELSLTAAMTCIDHMLGGPGGEDQPQRPLSDIETELFQDLLKRVCSELRYSFESLVTLKPKVALIEYNPQFAQAYSASDTIVVASFDMRIGTNECVSTMCIPLNGILPRLDAASEQGVLSERNRLAREAATAALAKGLELAPVDVSIQFSSTSMKPSDIIGLNVGDVVRLGHRANDPMSVVAGDTVFAYAVPGTQGTKLACLIVNAPEEDQ